MILLLSNDQFQSTLDETILWIRRLGGDYLRLNDLISDYNYDELNIDFENDSIIIGGKRYTFEEFNVIWHYRFGTKEGIPLELAVSPKLAGNEETILWHLNKTNDTLSQYLFTKLSKKKWYNFPRDSTVNKLIVLDLAKKRGIRIPKTIISSDKKTLHQFVKSCSNGAITKPVWEVFSFSKDNLLHTSYTSLVNPDDSFFEGTSCTPTLFQENISKKFEIRSFFIDRKMFSMAIFSQQNDQTKTDFRVYDRKVPNRTVPINLPFELEVKLLDLMNDLRLNTGSIDLIYTTEHDYVFLEVNPVGQFGMTSKPCNYYLEKMIAETLIRNDHE